jgi:hypothetical protein
MAEVGRLERSEIGFAVLLCGLFRGEMNALQLQRRQRPAAARQHGLPGLRIYAPRRGPRDRQTCQMSAASEYVEGNTVCRSSVKAVDPHASDLRGHCWEVVAQACRLPEGYQGIAVHSTAGRAVNELVERIALSPIGKLRPPLQQVSTGQCREDGGRLYIGLPLHPPSDECKRSAERTPGPTRATSSIPNGPQTLHPTSAARAELGLGHTAGGYPVGEGEAFGRTRRYT